MSELEQVLDDYSLVSDVSYLIDLLTTAAEEDRPLVVSRLTWLTKQDFGTDARLWSQWLKSTDAP